MAELKVNDIMVIKALSKKCKDRTQSVIKVVSFNDKDPVLVKQTYYKDKESGKWMPGKLSGFTYDDLLLIKNKQDRAELFEALKPDMEDED